MKGKKLVLVFDAIIIAILAMVMFTSTTIINSTIVKSSNFKANIQVSQNENNTGKKLK